MNDLNAKKEELVKQFEGLDSTFSEIKMLSLRQFINPLNSRLMIKYVIQAKKNPLKKNEVKYYP